ncbi:MAG: GH3 auxin-responsive promoter family protein, partial [Planctomycetes bacterium]|nr:GH3 auxin-responsive promoter family protein [Planctomycetota bacterium]
MASTGDCREVQRGVLRRLLSLNAESHFGKLHRLNEIRTVADFRRNLPVADYEYYREPIERMKQGDPSALLGPKNRLLMFTLSSGTTSQSKFIPITQQFLDDYRRGWQVWGINAIDDHPQISSGQILQLCSDYDRFRTPGNTPCGNISGLVAAMQKRIVRTMYTIPQVVSKIRDADAKHYTTLRLALADQRIRMVVTANPSTLIHLAKMAGKYREALIRDIADGTLSSDFEIGNSIRSGLRRHIARPNRARARFLERLVESTGELTPRDYWPEVELVCVWTGGSAGVYLNSLKQFYGDVPIRDHGLSASEGRMTIPLHNQQSEGILDLNTHYYEFIPEQEHDSDNPTVLEAYELEEGKNYFILLTTASGLYRYDICDVVRCVGFYQTTPMLEFLHK